MAAPSASVSLRAAEKKDLLPVAHLIFEAFSELNKAVNVDVEIDFANLDVAIAAVRTRLEDTLSEGIVAVESPAENIVGVGFITYGGEVHSLTLIAVSPTAANRGIGKGITSSLLEKSTKTAAVSVRLVQTTSNTRSFSLYVKLGFHPAEYWNNFVGKISPEKAEVAALSLGFSLNGYVVRKMEDSDIIACSNLFKTVMGYDRETQTREKLRASQGEVRVVLKNGSIMGYTTGFTRSGYAVAATEESCIALYASAPYLHLYILGQLYPLILQWCFRVGLPLIRHGTLMTLGSYQRPRQGMVWNPCGII